MGKYLGYVMKDGKFKCRKCDKNFKLFLYTIKKN